MCAPCRVGARSWSWRRAISLPAVVSSFMNTLHSVVLRGAVQYRLGYEFAEYSGVVSSGIICDVWFNLSCKYRSRF